MEEMTSKQNEIIKTMQTGESLVRSSRNVGGATLSEYKIRGHKYRDSDVDALIGLNLIEPIGRIGSKSYYRLTKDGEAINV